MDGYWGDPRIWAPAVSAFAAFVALIFNGVQLSRNTTKIELDTFDRIHSKIIDIERRLSNFNPETTTQETVAHWRGDLLNAMEYAAFLFNHEYIQDKRLLKYWADCFIVWYEKFFLSYATQADLSTPTLFNELKKCMQISNLTRLPSRAEILCGICMEVNS